MNQKMNKRIKRKKEKQKAILEFSHMTQHCDECGSDMIIKDKPMIINDQYLGKFITHGFHPVCVKCGEEFYTSDLMKKEKKLIKQKIQELLLKNYPPEKYEYISIDTISKNENISIDDLIKQDNCCFPIFYITKNNKHFYLKKSYDLYKKSFIKYHAGWFDITIKEIL